jgi:uncharacterized membrane protein
MTTIERHIDINVPASVAYAQWTQFEDMPRIMERVESVEQLDDRHLRWRVKAGGAIRTWDAEITEQLPDKRIAWTSTNGLASAGCVTFHRLADDACRVMLQMDFHPEGVVEKVAAALSLVERGVAAELSNFKRFLERRRAPTGNWRGTIPSLDDRNAAHRAGQET